MGVDYDGELGDTWMRMVRDRNRAGLPVRTRPATDRREAQLAAEVNRRVERQIFGYSGSPATDPDAVEMAVCDRCGRQRPLDALRVYDIWRLSGGVQSVRVPRYECAPECRQEAGE